MTAKREQDLWNRGFIQRHAGFFALIGLLPPIWLIGLPFALYWVSTLKEDGDVDGMGEATLKVLLWPITLYTMNMDRI